MGSEGLQEGPPVVHTDDLRLEIWGDDNKSPSAEVTPGPHRGESGVRLVYVDAGLSVDIDVDASKGESGELLAYPPCQRSREPGFAGGGARCASSVS
jgi:hypothetical protein